MAVLAGVDRVGVLVLRASAPPVRTADARSGLAVRPERRVERHHHGLVSGRSRCNRLCHNVICCSTRPVPPMRPGRRRWPRRYRPAVIPVCRWWDRTAPTHPTARRAPDRLPATTPRGPVVPKSVTDNATRCGNRSASSSQEVPYAAAWPGIPLSTTMSALPASSISRSRSSGSDGSSTVLRLFALCSAKRTPVPRSVGRLRAGRAAARRLHLQDVGAQVGQQPGDRVAVVVAQVEYPQRRQSRWGTASSGIRPA